MIGELDAQRFSVAMFWLADKYPTFVQGKTTPRQLTTDWLTDYFEALSDLPIEMIEAGAKYHYGHSEFFPEHPAALRKSIEALPVGSVKYIEREICPEKLEQDDEDMTPTPPEVAAVKIREIFAKINGSSVSSE